MIFVFDLDDTVCDTDAYSEKYISEFIKKNNLPYKQIAKETRFAEAKFDWDRETALEWYKKDGDEMMLNFPCKGNSVEIINKLYDLGHKIVIATARGDDWHTDPVGVTKKWLENNKIKYNKLHIGRVDKEKICEEEKADFFIDDDIKITSRVGEYFKKSNNGGKCFLMNTLYNKTLECDENVIRVNNFNEFYRQVFGK